MLKSILRIYTTKLTSFKPYLHWYRYALYSREANLIDILHRIIATYNKRVHSALHGMTPEEVITSPAKQWLLWELRFPHLHQGQPRRAELDPNAPPIGSFVRIAKKRSERQFVKETNPLSTAYSNAIYQVIRYDLMLHRGGL